MVVDDAEHDLMKLRVPDADVDADTDAIAIVVEWCQSQVQEACFRLVLYFAEAIFCFPFGQSHQNLQIGGNE